MGLSFELVCWVDLNKNFILNYTYIYVCIYCICIDVVQTWVWYNFCSKLQTCVSRLGKIHLCNVTSYDHYSCIILNKVGNITNVKLTMCL